MTKILKNTSVSAATVGDTGVTIAGSGQYTIPSQDYLLWGASSNVVTFIGAGTLVVNDGSVDLSINAGTSLIQGNYPTSILSRTQDGVGVAITSTLTGGKQGIDVFLSNTSTAVTQSGTWNLSNISGTITLPTGASTSVLQTSGNTSLSSIDTKTPALGQALAAASTPVVLTAAQLSTLTPLTTIAVTQSGTWTTGRTWALSSGADSVSAVQSGTWNVTNISGVVSLPTGASTESSLAKLTLLQSSTTSGQSGSLHMGAVTTAAPSYTTGQTNPLSLTLAGAMRVDASATTQPIVGTVTSNIGTTNGLALDTSVNSLLKPASTLAAVTTLGSITNTVVVKADTLSNQTSAFKVDGSAVTQPISAVSLPLPAGASTSVLQTSGNSSLTSIDGKTPALGQALAAGSVPAVLPATQMTTLSATQGPVTGGTAAANSGLAGGVYTNTLPILLPGQQAALQLNYRAELQVAPSLNPPTADAASRLRVSESNQALGYTYSLSDNSLAFNSALTLGGTTAHTPSVAAMRLATTTTSGSEVLYQTKKYLRYTPGVSHMINLSSVVGAAKANVRRRLGFFDAQDGLFFQQTSTTFSIVVRTSTSGSVVDNIINQASWNLDKLDGTGPSGVTLDPSKHNLYLIDFTWHGSSRVRFGALLNGVKVYCHEYIASNVFTTPYTRSSYLPIRFELTNTAATASTTTLDIIAMSAFKESSERFAPSYNFSRSTGRILKTANATNLPFLSIRPKTTFAGITNRIMTQPTGVQVSTNAITVIVQLVANAVLTGASFISAGASSSVEYDTTASSFSGGTVIAEFFSVVSVPETFSLADFADAILLGLDILGTTQDTLTIAIQSTVGNTTTSAAIRWGEYQ